MMKRIVSICMLCLFPYSLFAEGREIFNLAQDYFSNGDYYSTITEVTRYKHLYPKGAYEDDVSLLLGRSYYSGGNYAKASDAFLSCYENYKNRSTGELSLLYLGYMRLEMGSSFYSYGTFQEYLREYPKGEYREEAQFYLIYASLFSFDAVNAGRYIDKYKESYPQGKYIHKAIGLEKELLTEAQRPKKSMAIAVTGSVILPGFGHFYTGNYKVGIFSLLSNAICILLIVNGIYTGNTFQIAFFSLAELSFYQYALYSAVRNVQEYNSDAQFLKKVNLGMSKEF